MNKPLTTIILLFLLALSLSACGGATASETNDAIDTNGTITENEVANEMKMTIGDTEVSVEWEENESVEALMELAGKEPLDFTRQTAIGALAAYVSDPSVADFQPMNVNFGIIEPLGYRVRGKRNKNALLSRRALDVIAGLDKA